MKTIVPFLAFAVTAITAGAADEPAPSSTAVPAHAAKQTNEKIPEIHVSVSMAERQKGILILLPEALSASHRGTDVEFNYSIANTLEEALFVEVEPVENLSIRYSDDSGSRSGGGGSFTMGPHGRRYALLSGSDYSSGERVISCCSMESRKARVKLPKFANAGGNLKVTLFVRGYFLKNGQQFSGTVEAPIKLSE